MRLLGPGIWVVSQFEFGPSAGCLSSISFFSPNSVMPRIMLFVSKDMFIGCGMLQSLLLPISKSTM